MFSFKNLLLFGCLFIVMVLVVFMLEGKETLIRQNLSVQVEIPATQYLSDIVIQGSPILQSQKNLSLEDKNTIISTYNAIQSFVGENSICKGGSFGINPAYFYKDGQRIQGGFESNFNLSCSFNSEQQQNFNTILQKIQMEVDKNPYLQFLIPNIRLEVSNAQILKSQEILNVKLLELAMQQSLEYSKLLDKQCAIQEITLGTQAQTTKAVNLKVQMDLSSTKTLENITMPTANAMQKSLEGSVVFLCK